MSITVSSTVDAEISLSSAESVKAVHDVLQYGINNMPSGELPPAEDVAEIQALIAELATLF